MAEIRIEGKPVTGINGDGTFGHLYLATNSGDTISNRNPSPEGGGR